MITKLFVGYYYFQGLGYYHNIPRGATIIMPLMILTGGISAYLNIYPYENTITTILLVLTFIAIYFGFIHFWIFPAKWENMDESQKWQQGKGIREGVLTNTLTAAQWAEWNMINKKYTTPK